MKEDLGYDEKYSMVFEIITTIKNPDFYQSRNSLPKPGF